MAEIKLSFKGKAKASALAEVIVAMVIIIAVFTTALTIFVHVTDASISYQKIRAGALLEKTAGIAAVTSDVHDDVLNSDGLKLIQVVRDYPGEPKLLQIDLTAYDEQNNKLAELHQIIIKKHE